MLGALLGSSTSAQSQWGMMLEKQGLMWVSCSPSVSGSTQMMREELWRGAEELLLTMCPRWELVPPSSCRCCRTDPCVASAWDLVTSDMTNALFFFSLKLSAIFVVVAFHSFLLLSGL